MQISVCRHARDQLTYHSWWGWYTCMRCMHVYASSFSKRCPIASLPGGERCQLPVCIGLACDLCTWPTNMCGSDRSFSYSRITNVHTIWLNWYNVPAYCIFLLMYAFLFMHIENKAALMDICFKYRLIPLKVDDDMDDASSWKANRVNMEAPFSVSFIYVSRLCSLRSLSVAAHRCGLILKDNFIALFILIAVAELAVPRKQGRVPYIILQTISRFDWLFFF